MDSLLATSEKLSCRQLFDASDGKTTGSATFAVEIGKQIQKMCNDYSQSLSSQLLVIYLKFHKK